MNQKRNNKPLDNLSAKPFTAYVLRSAHWAPDQRCNGLHTVMEVVMLVLEQLLQSLVVLRKR